MNTKLRFYLIKKKKRKKERKEKEKAFLEKVGP